MKKNLITLALLTSSCVVYAAPTLTVSTTTNSRDFPLSADTPLIIPLEKGAYTLSVSGLQGECQAKRDQSIKFNQPIALNCQQTTQFPLTIRFSGDYRFDYHAGEHTLTFTRAPKTAVKTEFKRPLPNVACEVYQGGEVTIALGDTFRDGTVLRDAYSQQKAVVNNGQVRLTPSDQSGGLVLLEPVKPYTKPATLDYRNANIYFVMVDRFNNADTSNDHSYGRKSDGLQEIGTFHGGDLKGVIAKLDYIKSLGTDAIWLSPIVEQVHGFVGGGDKGSFPFYAYHGYWTRDFTKLDANFGTEEDLKNLVTQAHQRGIKVLMDAVLNHSGYSTLADLQLDGIEVVQRSALPKEWRDWAPKPGQTWHDYHQFIDYQSMNWATWWGKDWVRTGLPGYSKPGTSDIELSLAGLPDFKTGSSEYVTPPQWLLDNPGTRVKAKANMTVSDYLIEWQTDWVKRFGIDGFRVDTVKHVEPEVWLRLKQMASERLHQWQEANHKHGQPFWMMGEVWGHVANRSPYFDDGFDALISFDMQKQMDKGAACFSQMAPTYRHYADTMRQYSDFNPVSYMSSHDTELFFSRFKSYAMQRNAANALLLSPGAVQVYYGDEVGRDIGPYADDFHQGTRSDMVWDLNADKQKLLKHWQIIGQFRHQHPAIGAGVHTVISQDEQYVFSRQLGDDKVVVAFVGREKK